MTVTVMHSPKEAFLKVQDLNDLIVANVKLVNFQHLIDMGIHEKVVDVLNLQEHV